jgi:uncharacterized protein DUF302
MTVSGLTTVQTALSPDDAVRKLEDTIRARGMAVLARIDHAAAATAAGLALRPTLLLVFGNATAGTPLMHLAGRCGPDPSVLQPALTDRRAARPFKADSQVQVQPAPQNAANPGISGPKPPN